MPSEPRPPAQTSTPEFWERLAQELQCAAARTGMADADDQLSPEEEELLWAIAESQLSHVEEQQCLDLVSSNAAAARRLLAIRTALDAAESVPPGRADAVWARATTAKPPAQPSVFRQVQDLIIELAAVGLKLVYSAGRPAYAPALARGPADVPPTSIAHEFLTGIGTIQLVVDQAAPSTCDVTVIASRLLNQKLADALLVRLQTAAGNDAASATLQHGRVRLEGLVPGSYQLLLCEAERELDRLALELQPENSTKSQD